MNKDLEKRLDTLQLEIDLLDAKLKQLKFDLEKENYKEIKPDIYG